MAVHGLVIDDPKLNFSSSHFIVDHDKCERLHGHNYHVKIELEGALQEDSMVLDFKVAKDAARRLCDHLDHRILVPEKSPLLEIEEHGSQLEVKSRDKRYSFPREDCLLLPIPATTAEELAGHIYRELKKRLPQIKKVYVAESEGSVAYYSEG
ncbi:MAG: 6-carboxytetrahydropterin synthase [Methanobacteriota archaeon]|nr:MAG: 6-carboxytetrahydropterin synthase [Euryarchaeota archaeon]